MISSAIVVSLLKIKEGNVENCAGYSQRRHGVIASKSKCSSTMMGHFNGWTLQNTPPVCPLPPPTRLPA